MSEPRILIIDDEENIRETMRLALEAVGYRVGAAVDGPDGLQQFGTGEQWDLVLLDQRMPAMEGLEVLRRVRERDPSARLVMVTAYGSIELAVDALKAGAVDFLRKPFSPDVLRGAVKAALEHPRTAVAGETYPLAELTAASRLPRPDVPLVQFRTLNGFQLRTVSIALDDQETEALRVRRVFDVKAPGAETRRCVVEVSTGVQGQVREITGEEYSPHEPIWDLVCRSALSNYLWERAELLLETLLAYSLTREQVATIYSFAGLPPRGR